MNTRGRCSGGKLEFRLGGGARSSHGWYLSGVSHAAWRSVREVRRRAQRPPRRIRFGCGVRVGTCHRDRDGRPPEHLVVFGIEAGDHRVAADVRHRPHAHDWTNENGRRSRSVRTAVCSQRRRCLVGEYVTLRGGRWLGPGLRRAQPCARVPERHAPSGSTGTTAEVASQEWEALQRPRNHIE